MRYHAYGLAHISDLVQLQDEHVAEFQAAVPGIVSRLKIAAAYAKDIGRPLSEVQTWLTFRVPSVDSGASPAVASSPEHVDAPASAYNLVHITDLAGLAQEHVVAFQKDVPGLVAMLKIAKEQCEELGCTLQEMFPHITFVPDMGEVVVLRTPELTAAFTSEEVQTARKARP